MSRLFFFFSQKIFETPWLSAKQSPPWEHDNVPCVRVVRDLR
jgi:hypothetical protein